MKNVKYFLLNWFMFLTLPIYVIPICIYEMGGEKLKAKLLLGSEFLFD